jgi:amino acid adenylation domain-containing protein
MLRRFVEACEAYPDRDALCIQGARYTYAQLAATVAGLLDLIEDAVGDGEKALGVFGRDEFLAYAAIFATALSGRAFVPIQPEAPPARNAELIRQAGLRTLFGGDEVVPEGVRLLDASRAEPRPRRLRVPESSDDHLAYLLFTSGSTGTPKGVPIAHGNLSAFLDALQATCPLDESDRVLQMFDLTFDFSIATYIAPLCRGACVYPVPPGGFRFSAIADLLEQEGLTVAPMVPSVLPYLRSFFDEIRLPRLRQSYFCGEALHRDVLREWESCIPNAAITNFYGPTEATVFSLYYRWSPAQGRDKSPGGVVSLGRPLEGMRALVVDASGEPVARGGQGELCLAGPQVMRGYWHAAERTAAAFLPRDPLGRGLRWYRTGDLAVEDEDGDFSFCGRLDEQVKIQGYRVELGEIESAARRILASAQVAAVAVEGAIGNAEIHLFVAAAGVDEREIRRLLGQALPRYMLPASVTALEALPLSPNGKIDRRRLRERVAHSGGTP